MDDKKLEMFFSKELWNETIEKAVSNEPWRSGHCLKHIKNQSNRLFVGPYCITAYRPARTDLRLDIVNQLK